DQRRDAADCEGDAGECCATCVFYNGRECMGCEGGVCGIVGGDPGEQYHRRYESGGTDADLVVRERDVGGGTGEHFHLWRGDRSVWRQCADRCGAGGYEFGRWTGEPAAAGRPAGGGG